jgi:PAS domain S-box-containing protein
MLAWFNQELARHVAIETQLRAILGALGEAVIAADSEGHVTFMNRGAMALTGWPEEHALGRPLTDVFQLASSGVLHSRDHGRILIQQRSLPLGMEGADGVVVIFREVAWGERSEGAQERALAVKLARAADRAARLQDLTAACSAAHTPADVAVQGVTRGCAVLGAPRGLLFLLTEDGSALELVQYKDFPLESLDTFRRFPMSIDVPLTEVARTGEALFFESAESMLARYPLFLTVKRPEDNAVAALPLVVEGRVLGVLGFMFDEPHHFDADEKKFILALARQCANALDRASLYEGAARARAAAEAASHVKDDLLATLSHELRTPLTAILGWAHMLCTKTPDEDTLARGLQSIERNAQTLVQLIDTLLDASRVMPVRTELR